MVKQKNNKKEIKLEYNKIKKNIKSNKEYKNIYYSIKNIKSDMNSNIDALEIIKNIAKSIVKKSKDADPEKMMEALPVENLRELSGDFSKKITFQDMNTLTKMQKQSIKIIENQNELERKKKILNIELLQKQIELLLNDL